MEKKSGFFATLKQEVVRGLSPSRSRPKSRHPSSSSSSRRSKSPIPSPLLLLRRRTTTVSTTNNSEENNREDHLYSCNNDQDPLSGRCSGTVRNAMEVMAPLMEGPEEGGGSWEGDGGRKEGWGQWVKGQLSRGTVKCSDGVGTWLPEYKRSDLRLLLGVMGAPLAPVGVSSLDHFPHLSIKDTPIESSSAQYIIQQYLAASGGQKLHNSIKNAYAMGKVKMLVSEFETATKVMKNCSSSRVAESGGFVLWQMNSDMWYVELSAGGSKVHAGCNGKLVWRHTPWLGAHAAKGPVRPLRRALQGLDPRSTAKMFANARCIGEKKLNGEDCFVLKLSADAQNLKARSEGPAEIIRHVIFGYFSQRTGLLLQIEDSHLTRIQSSNCGDAVYWETTINSFLDDYLPVEGMMIAHSGRSVVTLFKFGEVAMSHSKTRMEESWTIEEVAYNVPGLSVDCFIPPADIRCRSVGVPCELPRGEKGKTMSMSSSHNRSKVATIGQQQDNLDNVVWRVEI